MNLASSRSLLRAATVTPELERYNVITLYCLVSQLIDSYVIHGLETAVHDWFIAFEQERYANGVLEDDEKDLSLVEYRRLISQSTDTAESIRARLETLERRFFSAYPEIEQKDPNRGFSHGQRLAIYRRDDATCQLKLKCDGVRVAWGEWHADHRVAHTHGGKTVVANGQVACTACNLAKGMKIA